MRPTLPPIVIVNTAFPEAGVPVGAEEYNPGAFIVTEVIYPWN